MTRKLLPYEYDLIDTLGVSKEEYLEFLAVQQIYSDPKEGTIFDIRNDPGTQALIALILAIIGTIAQVVSILLAPKPQGGGQRQTRNQRFAPRFGFNSQQELAKYGDPINLVYADTTINPKGGVRVAASLIWSAVRSYGSSQFLQQLMVLGAGKIKSIAFNKSAFGQTTVNDLTTENKWLYFKPSGTGVLQWASELENKSANDPSLYGVPTDNPYRLQTTVNNVRTDGYSQAYSPSTQSSIGVYGVVPINVLVFQRNSAGDKENAELGIISSWNWQTLQAVAINFKFTLTIKSTLPEVGDVATQAQEVRRGLASTFDKGGVFKLGSASFIVETINVGSPDEQDMIITLKCVEEGNAPAVPYASTALESDKQIYKDNLLSSQAYVTAKSKVDLVYTTDQRINSTILDIIQNNSIKLSMEAVFTSGNIFVRNSNTAAAVGFTGSYKLLRPITQDEQNAYIIYKNTQAAIAAYKGENFFFTKCLVRSEYGSYRTLQSCHIVDFAFKNNIYKQLSGRQEEYGSRRITGYPTSDNGVKNRTSLFLIRCQKGNGATIVFVPGIFAISRTSDIDNFNYVKFISADLTPAGKDYWSFRFVPIADFKSEIAKRPELRDSSGKVPYYYIENAGAPYTVQVTNNGSPLGSLNFVGRRLLSSDGLPPLNENPSGLNEWDLFNLDADNQINFSFDNGPEIAITCVSEQIVEPFNLTTLYSNLSLLGFNVYSGRNLQDLRSFTAFVTEGRLVRRLITSGTGWGTPGFNYLPSAADGATCFAPDIFIDTVLDKEDGIGKYAVIDGVNVEQLARTKLFCERNKLYMEGVIADQTNWREFWVEAAPYSLLEFARIGGRETLIPAVPYNPNTGEIQRLIKVTALFNQGNILEDSYKEEYLDYGSNVQDLIASVIYRSTDTNGIFAQNKTLEVRLKDTVVANAVRQTFDLSQFVTTPEQAVLYAKLVCNLRRHVRRAIEFRTFPTQEPIAPGAFIYIDIGQNAWNGVRTGVIRPGGNLNIPLDNNLPDGSYKFLLYRSGDGIVSVTATVTNNVANALATYNGWLFVLGTQAASSKRIFRVSEVQMDEEGEITVRASEYPCDTSDNSLIADFNDALFTVTGALS
jgi:hypothetical protein